MRGGRGAGASGRLLLICAAALLLAGCTFPGSTGPMVKIGLVAPFEGLYRPLGYEALYAMKLAVRERNAAGGVGGYMVELVALDDSGDPAQAALSARKMAVDPDVMGVIGHFLDETTVAALDEYHRAGLALIAPAAANEVTERGYPEVFRLFATNERLGAEAARYAVVELGAKRLAVLRGREDLAQAFARATRELGATVVLDANVEEVDWAALAEAGPDAIFFSGGAVCGAELMVEARRAGIEAILVGGSELDKPHLVRIGGEAVEGAIYVTSAPDPAGAQGFVARYRALAGHPPGPRAVLAYDAACALLEALEQVIEEEGRPGREGVVAALAKVRYEGLLGPIAFNARGDWAAPRVCVYRIEGGRYPGRQVR
ncbi:MAG TPA: branched-chain amino acid ABC transporter substrate-binding protein [Anaerolineae bacterium]|nr:branched-chain amino acid ABC transporter substrate-binding protein [Anaerolineae bacterium]